jgi:hypothetical protein
MPDGKRLVVIAPAGTGDANSLARPSIHVVLNWFEELKAKAPTGSRK